MTRAWTMTRLDLLSTRPYAKQGLMLLAVAAALGFAMGDPSAVVPMTMMYAVLVASYPFAIADKNDLDTLYATLPVPRVAMLVGRYLYALVLFVVAAGAGALIALAVAAVEGRLPTGGEAGLILAVGFALYALMVALQYPVYLVLGYMRARLVAVVPFMLLLVAVLIIAPRIDGPVGPPPALAAPLLVAGGLVLLVASGLVAARLPRRDVC